MVGGAVLAALILLAVLRPGNSTETGLKPGVGPGNPGAAAVESNDSEATRGDPNATAEPTDLPSDVESDENSDDSDKSDDDRSDDSGGGDDDRSDDEKKHDKED